MTRCVLVPTVHRAGALLVTTDFESKVAQAFLVIALLLIAVFGAGWLGEKLWNRMRRRRLARKWGRDELAIAVAGPDVGMVGSRWGLERRGNEVRELEGGLIPRDLYPELHAVIGEKFGDGDGEVFRLPDLRGRGINDGL